MTMRVALYARVSTREQVQEGYSISAQLKSLKAFSESQGWDIVGTYTDGGVSAKDTDRAQLQRMINDIKDGKIDVVLVYRLDRLTRSVLDLYELLDFFDKNDCGFKSATEVYDTTTAMGRLFITIVAALAQWERENLGERVSMGMMEKARQGEFPGGRAPYGFRIENSTLIINEEEAKVVRLIYEKYAEGYGMNKVAQFLNEHNIRTRAGGLWYRSSIKTILESEAVRGNLRRNDDIFKNTHEPIVDKATADNVRFVIKDRTSRIKASSVSSDFLFSGIIKCCHCGSNLHGTSSKSKNKTHYYYRCPEKRRGNCNGDNTTVSEYALEKQLIDRLSTINLKSTVDEIDIKADEETPVEELERELEKIGERKKKWQFAWMNELITDDDLKERMKEESEKESDIKEQLNNNEPEKYDTERIKEILTDMKSNWEVLNRRNKKQLLQMIIKDISYRKVGRNVILTSINLNM